MTTPIAGMSRVTDYEIDLHEGSWIDLAVHDTGWVIWGLVGEPGSMKTLALAYRAIEDHTNAFCTDGWTPVMDGTVIKGFRR